MAVSPIVTDAIAPRKVYGKLVNMRQAVRGIPVMIGKKEILGICLAVGMAVPAQAQMKMESSDVAEGVQIKLAQVLAECHVRGKERGGNISPALSWSGVPEGTKSFAITMFDPMDGKQYFWHWIVFNIPASVTALPAGVSGTAMPEGTVEGMNDFGTKGYGGPCPPRGTTHRYIFNVWALDTPRLSLSGEVTGPQIRPLLQLHSLGKATLTARYEN